MIWVKDPIAEDLDESQVHSLLSESHESFLRRGGRTDKDREGNLPSLRWLDRPFSLAKDVGLTGRGLHIAEAHHFLPSWMSGNVKAYAREKLWSYDLLEAEAMAELRAHFDAQAADGGGSPLYEVKGEGIEAVVGLFIRPVARILLRLSHPKFTSVTAARASEIRRTIEKGGMQEVANLHREVVALIPIEHPVSVVVDAQEIFAVDAGHVMLTGAGRLKIGEPPEAGADPWVLVVGMASKNAEDGPEATYRERCPVHFQQSYHHKGLMHKDEL